MPLINLTTDLKSLQYGNDRPGGGSSGLPYIVSPRPDQIVPPQDLTSADDFTKFYELNRSTQDYPIRGGSIELSGETGYSTTPAGQIDRNRIKAYMSDPQKGKIFLLKQAGLQLSNPKTLGTYVLAPAEDGNVRGRRITSLLEATRYYDPKGKNTIAQVGTQGTGVHITRHGTDFGNYLTGLAFGYEASAKQNNEEGTNRLALLRVAKLNSDNPIYNPFVGKSLDYGISTINSQILNYEGGPGSNSGVGSTIINRATNTNTSRAYSSIAFSYDTIMSQTTTDGYFKAHPKLQDFRKQLTGKRWYEYYLPPIDYDKDSIENRLKIGNPGGLDLDQGYDELNAQELYAYNAESNDPWNVLIGGKKPPKDLIKFTFECLNNDYPGQAVALLFRAFLSGITDNHQAEFNTFKYLGRGETFRTYQGFDRSVSFSFKIATFSATEMEPLYTKLNHLISQVYPDYSETSRFMRGNVIRLTIGDYLYRVPGFLENVNVTIDDNAAWEIALNDPAMRELPQMVTVQCSFKPIHDFLPRREKLNDEYVPFIANTKNQYLNSDMGVGLPERLVPPLPETLPIAPQATSGNLTNAINLTPIAPPKRKRKPATIIFAPTENDPANPTFGPGTSGYIDPVTGAVTP